jgi:hypothetical protein
MNIFSIKVREFTHPYVKYTVNYNNELCEMVDVKTISPKASAKKHIKGDFLRMVIYTFVVIQEDIDINLLHIGENMNTGNRTFVPYKYKCDSKSVVIIQHIANPSRDYNYVLLSDNDIVNMYTNLRIITIPDAPTERNKKPFLTNDNCLYNVGITDERTVASPTVNTIPPNRNIMTNDNDVYSVRSVDKYNKNREPKTFSCCVIS